MRIPVGLCATLLAAAPLVTAGSVEAPAAGSPVEVVQQATAAHIDTLNSLIEKVPAPQIEKIQKAIEVSRRGAEKALEALDRAHVEGTLLAFDGMTAQQARGVERAIQAIEEATDRTTSRLESVLDRVPEQAEQAIVAAIDRIEAGHAQALERLEGLLVRGVSTAHPPTRPEVGPPARPELPTQAGRPEIARPAIPVTPPRPERPVRQ